MPRKWTPEQRQAAREKALARGFGTKVKGPSEATAAPQAKDGAIPKARPRNLFSGDTLKLQVWGKNGSDKDPIPGYRLYWFNDVEGGLRIAQAKASGWEMVTRDEVALNAGQVTPDDNDLGSHVRRWVAQGNDGAPVFAFLMKKPLDLDREHQMEREALHDKIEMSLLQGTFNMQPGERRYNASNPPVGSPSGLPPISISSKLSR